MICRIDAQVCYFAGGVAWAVVAGAIAATDELNKEKTIQRDGPRCMKSDMENSDIDYC
jgi:hypothetical protein